MKSHLTKVCLALLSAVFILGCQDLGSGPVGPEGVVPQFNKPNKNGDHNHGADDGGGPTYNISMIDGDISFGSRETFNNSILIVEGVSIDLAFFNDPDKLSCALSVMGSTVFEGDFVIKSGSSDPPHMHFSFEFEHNGATHHLGSRIEGLPNNTWPPTVGVSVMQTDGPWAVTSKGRNHDDACTGEGLAGPGSGITFTISIVPVETP